MRIDVLAIEGCPNAQFARDEVDQALFSLGLQDVVVAVRLISTSEDAVALGFAGSPTVLIDGVDAVPCTLTGGAQACRMYSTAQGIAGHPSSEQLVKAIRDRMAAADG